MTGAVLSIFGVEPRRVGGVETFARELSCHLAEFGRRSILCFLKEPPPAVREFLELPNVTLEVLDGVAEPGLATLREAGRLFWKHRPDIVHLYFTGLLSPFPWLARWYGARKVYFTDQGSHPEGYEGAPASPWKRVIGRLVTLPLAQVISISDYNAQVCARRGYVPAGRIARIYNSVDLSRRIGDGAEFRRRYGIPDNRAVVVQASWLIPEKGIEDLLEAARRVLAANPAVQFVIVGDGAFRDAYVAQAQDAGIADHVTWTGLVADPVAEGVYSAADVVCQLSRWQEAFGWVIAEAMACSRPVVATRVGGIPEIVADGRSGFLVARRNPAEAAARILELLADVRLRREMGTAGRHLARARFDLEQNVAELLKLYGIAQQARHGAPSVVAH